MPSGDGSGPMGMGPMTGRAAGYCAGSPVPGYMNAAAAGRGLGMGRGFGGGRGRRNRFYATGMTGRQRAAVQPPAAAVDQFAQAPNASPNVAHADDKAQQLSALRQQAELLGDSLQQIKRRIDELQSQSQAE